MVHLLLGTSSKSEGPGIQLCVNYWDYTGCVYLKADLRILEKTFTF